MNFPNKLSGFYSGRVGDHLELGVYGGAYTARYRIAAFTGGRADLVRVLTSSVRNEDGTFSTVYTDAT